MAKINVLGNSLTITSGVKYDDILKAKKVAPEFTQLYKTSVTPPYDTELDFVVTVTEDVGSVSNHGIAFDSKDKAGYAYLTLAIDRNEEMDEAYFADAYMQPMIKLNEIELRIKEAMEYINKNIKAVTEDIKIIG